MHVNAFNLDPEFNSPKQRVKWFTYTTWGFPLPSWNLINDSIEFYRGFARGATSSLSWALVPQLAQSSDLPNITVLDFFKACNPLNQ